MGVYPMLLDETCFFVAIDFDDEGWEEDASVCREACRKLKLACALERSRSGKGGHLWIFFEEAIRAGTARDVGSLLLTEAMESRPEVGFTSYDRLFPNQDTMPKGGFGNLIALPLQKVPRETGNGGSVFVDESFHAYADQWEFLSSVWKLGRAEAETLAGEAKRRGRITGVRLAFTEEDDAQPWMALPSRRSKEPPIEGPVPQSLELVIADLIYVPKDPLPAALRTRLARLAAFRDPELSPRATMRLPTFGKPRILHCGEETSQYLALPRGCLEEIRALLARVGIKAILRDRRFGGELLSVKFRGELRPDQQLAAKAMVAFDTECSRPQQPLARPFWHPG